MKYLALALLLGCAAPRAAWSDYVVPYSSPGKRCSSVRMTGGMLATASHCVFPYPAGPDIHVTQEPLSWAGVTPSADIPSVGDRVTLVGYGCERFVRTGTWTGKINPQGMWVVRGLACHGDSGGGVFDKGGRLVGVMSAIAPGRVYVTLMADALPQLVPVGPVVRE